jgi:hypothetical protein
VNQKKITLKNHQISVFSRYAGRIVDPVRNTMSLLECPERPKKETTPFK